MMKILGPLPTRTVPPLTPWQQFRRDPVVSSARWIHSHRPARHPTRIRGTEAMEGLITLVCISDTHNTQPSTPDGDVLLHVGDLTNNGTFAELRARLTWLGSLPHRHKIVIAGNHDRLLDQEFVKQHPERIRETPGTARSDLNWHDILYLQDSSITISVSKDFTRSIASTQPGDATSNTNNAAIPATTTQTPRAVKIYGSPQTPLCGTFAFQYPPIRNVWSDHIPADADIVVVHGPPKGFLDRPIDGQGQEADNKGCPYLVRELMRVQPQVVVFGHIHSGHGKEVVRWRRRLLEGVFVRVMSVAEGEKMSVWVSWLLVSGMVVGLVIAWIEAVFGMAVGGRRGYQQGGTTLVNAAIGEDGDEHGRGAVIIEI